MASQAARGGDRRATGLRADRGGADAYVTENEWLRTRTRPTRQFSKAGQMAPFNRILLCYDATPEGRRALRCGAAIAQQLHAETHLLSILDIPWWSAGYDALPPVKFDIDEEAAKEVLSDGIKKLSAWGVTATGHFAVGSALEHIPRVANALKVDLIVIGHRSGGVFAGWWTAEKHALLLN